MSLKGQFNQIISQRVQGMRIYSFTLTNSAWLGSETFDAMLCDAYGQQPWYYRNQTLKSGQSFRFDFDTVDWQWCQGDFFAILGRKDKIVDKWVLNLKEYPLENAPNVTERTNVAIATVKAIRSVSMLAYHNAHIAEVQVFAQLVTFQEERPSPWP